MQSRFRSRSEQLLVTVDTHTGMFLAHVPQYSGEVGSSGEDAKVCPLAAEIQQTLNEDKSR